MQSFSHRIQNGREMKQTSWLRKCLASLNASHFTHRWLGIISCRKLSLEWCEENSKKNRSPNFVWVPLCCKCVTNDYQRSLAIKGNGNSDHIVLLWASVAKDRNDKIPTRCPGRFCRHEFGGCQDTELVKKVYMFVVSAAPSWSSQAPL